MFSPVPTIACRIAQVVFRGVATFTENTANSGGSGGAVSNLGYAKFKKRSYFYSNTAKGEDLED